MAAEPGDRTFIAAYGRNDNFPPYATWLYRIQLNSAGRVTGFAQFTYGVVDNLGVLGEMSISPDESQVAFPTCHLGTSTGQFCEVANEIEVVDLATGTQTLYQGGLPPVKAALSIKDVSWAPNGHTLVFLALWCHSLLGLSDACGSGTNLEQVRTLMVTSGGHSLGQGRVLLSASARYPNIVQAVLNPDGSSLEMLVGHGPVNGTYFTQSMVMEQLPLAPAGRPGVLYRGTFYGQDPVELAPDSTGRYWLMVSGLDRWIGPGGVHRLKPNYENDQLAW